MVDAICPRCQNIEETDGRLIFDWFYAKEIWRAVNLAPLEGWQEEYSMIGIFELLQQ